MIEGALSSIDKLRLREAALLARKGRGQVEPNPMVGALVAKKDQIIAKGYHDYYGFPHAEVHALKKAGEHARGATLYITLEPCSSQGKTPPCTEAILKAGIDKVAVGAIDPDDRQAYPSRWFLKRPVKSC